MAKVSLRDHGRAITEPTPAIDISKIEKEQMMMGLKLQTLESIRNVAMTGQSKTQKYDRIEQLLAGLGRDLTRIYRTPAND